MLQSGGRFSTSQIHFSKLNISAYASITVHKNNILKNFLPIWHLWWHCRQSRLPWVATAALWTLL